MKQYIQKIKLISILISMAGQLFAQTTGKDFYKDGQGGKTDWLGIDDGTRGLPSSYTTKSNFDTIGISGDIGKKTGLSNIKRL